MSLILQGGSPYPKHQILSGSHDICFLLIFSLCCDAHLCPVHGCTCDARPPGRFADRVPVRAGSCAGCGLSSSKYGVETLHTVITNEGARLGCAPFRNANLCWEEAGNLGTAASAEGADLIGSGRYQRRACLQEADAQRAKQACANPLPFIHQAKQQMHRAYALLSLALHTNLHSKEGFRRDSALRLSVRHVARTDRRKALSLRKRIALLNAGWY